METSGNQEPQQTQFTKDIEVTPSEAIPDVELAINTNNKSTTPEYTPNTNIIIYTNNETHKDTIEPPQPLESPGTTGDINQNISHEPVQSAPTTQNIVQPKHDIPLLCRSTRKRTHTKSYSPSISGNRYSYALTQM